VKEDKKNEMKQLKKMVDETYKFINLYGNIMELKDLCFVWIKIIGKIKLYLFTKND